MVPLTVFGVILFVLFSAGVTVQSGSYIESNRELETCSTDVSENFFVSDTASATYLAEEVNCSGGSFNVTWRGSVLIDRTISISAGTTLNVTGEGSGAEINGGGKTRLFKAEGATLHISGLILRNGNATYGGALHVVESNVSWDEVTSFVENVAEYNGGALYVYDSTVSWDGEASFVNNTAFWNGGAVSIISSIVSWDGLAYFTDNTASYDGGALYVYATSSVSWDGETFLVNNVAGDDGGAMYVYSDSDASWHGNASFVNNMANDNGGALMVSVNSCVSWDGETFLVNNMAGGDGGAMYVYSASVASWHGKASFVNNIASDNGGAMHIYDTSSVSWDGEASFVNNTAFSNGGAVSIDSSIVSWDGLAYFTDNTASYDGGALYAYATSSVSWDGETFLVNNMAGDDGGAMYVYFDSDASWHGNASFINNTANEVGGCMYVSSSTVVWDGVAYFTDNMAFVHGGAMYIYSNSTVSWHGHTSFVNNTAIEYGGALRGFQTSNISWDGYTSFLDNRAQHGGGLAVYDNSIVLSWTGETSFTANEAISDGGAIYATISSNITVGGETYFLDNEAAIDGGAVYLSDYGYDATSSSFIIDNYSTVLFQSNTCGGDGGAIALIGDVITQFSFDVTFTGNTAGVAGGAIYMSGVTTGIRFEGTRFISNSAVIGGGLYSTSSGTARSEDINGTFDQNPTAIIGCEFIGNVAKRTGGAMESGEGIDLIVNTSFAQNSAIIGGALSLVGTSSLIGCEFVANSAYENEGPAISNGGVITNFSGCSFVDNVFNCETGNYLEFNDTIAQLEVSCNGCPIDCKNCTFEGRQPTECVGALEHSSAEGVNATLESLIIEPGYWRATKTSTSIFACYNPDACLGGVTGADGYCLKGYEGPHCSVCSRTYTAGLAFTCNKCSYNTAGGIALTVVLAFVPLVAFVALFFYMISGERMTADRGIVGHVTHFIPMQSVKIVIVVWQVLTQFSAVANVVFPRVYQTFLDGVDVLNFDITWLLSTGCIIDTDFHDQLLLATLGPLVCIVILGGTYMIAMRRNIISNEARGIVRRKHVSMVLLLTFLIYSSVSSTLFKMFACDKLDDGKNYLRADYRIECDSSKHDALEVYAGFMIILYVVGIPAFYGGLLYNNRGVLMKNTERGEDENVKPITDLWKPYKPDRFYYEVIECVRRVLLTGALVFIYPNTAGQIAVALMMATFFIFVSEALDPYECHWDTWISRTGHAIVFTSMFLALLLKVDVTRESASSETVFESVLIAAHSCLILAVVIQAVATVMTLRKEVKEYPQPRMRRGCSQGVGKGGVFLEEAPPSYENEEENLEYRVAKIR